MLGWVGYIGVGKVVGVIVCIVVGEWELVIFFVVGVEEVVGWWVFVCRIFGDFVFVMKN